MSFIVFRYGEAGCVADDADVTNHTLEDAEQVRGGHHGVCDHIEACRSHDVRFQEPDRRVARARHRKLPQKADPFGWKA